jgi:hypothetical protein
MKRPRGTVPNQCVLGKSYVCRLVRLESPIMQLLKGCI